MEAIEFYLDGKRITKSQAEKRYGKDAVAKRAAEAKEVFAEDPNIENSWWMGNGMLTVKPKIR